MNPYHPSARRIVALGASTGGTQALEKVLTRLPLTCPPILIVQHMREGFIAGFAARLNGLCAIEVREARHRDRPMPGLALIAPSGMHMILAPGGQHYTVEIFDAPPMNRHKPSVDMLFRSVARHAGSNALGVLMTGMGNDGAHDLKEMRQAGARTAAQDAASCVIYGMPMEAVKLGAAEAVLELDHIHEAIVAHGRNA
jgi:two-component system chemotaxis response regulator CheB